MNRRDLLRAAWGIAAARFAAACQWQQADYGKSQAPLRSDPFALGVASGDPSVNGFVIWTRLIGELPPVMRVGYEVAEDEAFKRIVRRGAATAIADFGHALHIVIEDLRPGRDYWYRFHCAGAVSRSGRARTIPRAPSRLRAALVSCQHWEHGYFSAYADIMEQDVDVVFHVGDYIYESSFGDAPLARRFPSPVPRTLADYRNRYELYRSDPHLQDAHAATSFIATWDDHEVQNDYAGSESALGMDHATFQQMRAAAYQAYFEHLPLRPRTRLASGETRLYRTLQWPGLASLHVLDTRQYRSIQPCSPTPSRAGHAIPRCAEVDARERTLLGLPQERWLRTSLERDSARWSVLVQQTLFAPLRLPDDTLWSDFWDAYAHSRSEVISALTQPNVRNALILGGDLHSFWVNDIHASVNDPHSPVVATEVLTSCLASRNAPKQLFEQVRSRNPHVRHLDNSHSGYALLELDEAGARIDLRAVIDLLDPQSRSRSLKRFVIEDGRPGAIEDVR